MGIFGPSDRELMKMLGNTREGADAALRHLYARLWPRFWALWRRDNRDPDDSRDAFQHAVLELWKLAQTPSDHREVRIFNWLNTTAYHHWLNVLSKRKRLEDAAEEIRFRFLEADDSEHALRLQATVQSILARLDEACRRLLEARFLDGFDRSQLADLLQFSNLNSVTNKIDRCLDKAQLLGREMGSFAS